MPVHRAVYVTKHKRLNPAGSLQGFFLNLHCLLLLLLLMGLLWVLRLRGLVFVPDLPASVRAIPAIEQLL
jgi:hypothetical protein